MNGLISVHLALLLCAQTANPAQDQAGRVCNNEEMRRAVIKETLSALNDALLGLHPSFPANSCAEIFNNNTQNAQTGYHWLRSANGSAVRVYCDMTLNCKGAEGGWMQLIKLDMTNDRHQCPPGTRLRPNEPKRLCGSTSEQPGCSSTMFHIHGIKYRQVCGKIISYQFASTDAFGDCHQPTPNHSIEINYMDGISLTHGSNPRKHIIWSFAGSLDEVSTHPPFNCQCTDTRQAAAASQPPSYVGSDYFCDTASENRWEYMLYTDDPLWDGDGCGPNNSSCMLNDPPWFLKTLPTSTTDDIEMRMCNDEGFDNEDTPIEILELYVQ